MRNRQSTYNLYICIIIISYVSMVAIVDVIMSPIEESEANTPTYNQNDKKNRVDGNAVERKHEQVSIDLSVRASELLLSNTAPCHLRGTDLG